MNLRAISGWKATGFSPVHDPNDNNMVQPFRSVVSRRSFARAVAGTTVLGAAFGSESEVRRETIPEWSFAPVPIPTGSPALGGFYHVFGPGPVVGSNDPIDAEPATIQPRISKG